MEIRSLRSTGFDEIFSAFSEAFADYEMSLDKAQLRAMLTRRGFDPALSFAAFDGGRIAAFTLNGKGLFRGVATVYDTGTGTLPTYRGRGLAGSVFTHSIPYLKKAGIGQYLLEVLQHNDAAVSVYRKLGFAVTREFNYFRQDKSAVALGTGTGGGDITIEPIPLSAIGEFENFRDFEPSWQNGVESIDRAAVDLVALGARTGGNLVGYCVFEPSSGDITQIAVDKKCRRRGIASALLDHIVPRIVSDTVKVINTDTGCRSITEFLSSINIPVTGKQYEMIKPL